MPLHRRRATGSWRLSSKPRGTTGPYVSPPNGTSGGKLIGLRCAELFGDTAERWERDPENKRIIGHNRILHRQRHTIDYGDGDLRATDIRFDWYRLTTAGAARRLPYLNDHGPTCLLDRDVKLYVGTVDGVHVEIYWPPDEQITGRLREVHPDRIATLILKRTGLSRSSLPLDRRRQPINQWTSRTWETTKPIRLSELCAQTCLATLGADMKWQPHDSAYSRASTRYAAAVAV